ncbi:hypothetical protein LJR296_007663 [Cupriavidus necator]
MQAESGIGVKRFRLVWVFENEKVLTVISSGWMFGGQARGVALMPGSPA